jgi:prepilin-type N-terminal cleavage/methylation domain-containing protein
MIALIRQPSRAFTLIELLVVVAIVGTLVALVMPAIQEAREAGRRSACQNNLKQLGLGLLNYATVHETLPIGAHSNRSTHGVSWCVNVTPFLEEAAISDLLDMTSPHSGWVLMNVRNGKAVDRIVIPSMLCPSSPLQTLLPVGSFQLMMPSYVGIAGATSHDSFSETRVDSCCVPRIDGQVSAGGMLIPNRSISLREVSDGTSKTTLLGETSDFVYGPSGAPYRIDAGFSPGWIMGTIVEGTPPEYSAPFPAWNITTIRYRPNTRQYSLPGIYQERGPNNPLVSAHPGGVNVLFVAGAVSFIADDVDLIVYKKMATRDDGESIP